MIKTESESCSMLISARKSIFCSINLHIITGVIRSDITVQSYKANQNNF